MGRPIPSQKRGKGSGRYTAPSHNFKTRAHYRAQEGIGVVSEFSKDPSKTGIVMKVEWEDGSKTMLLAPEGMVAGKEIEQAPDATVRIGNILPLKSIPEGVPIFNIENKPGDGGKTVRSSGTGAFIVNKKEKQIMVKLPSKKIKPFNADCRATIGISAGGGRPEKPFVKAGNKSKQMKARGHKYPIVRGVAMNPVAHPHGGTGHHAGKPTTVSRNTPPGAKVGHVAAKRTGRRKRK